MITSSPVSCLVLSPPPVRARISSVTALPASSTFGWSWELDLARKRLAGTATLTLVARRERLAALTFDAVELDVESVTVDGRAADFDNDGEKLRVACPEPPAEGAKLDVAIRYACQPRRGLYFIGPDAEHPDAPGAVLDAGPGRRFAPLLALHRSPDREVHDRGHLHGAGRQLRAVERRAARARRAARRARALALRARVPAARLPGDAGGGPVRRDRGPRAAHGHRRLLLRRRPAARTTRAAASGGRPR